GEVVKSSNISSSFFSARPNSIPSGSVITSYTVEVDDGNFSSGVWTAPEDCVVLVSFSASYMNQASTGGRLNFYVRKNGSVYENFWAIGRSPTSVDDLTASKA